LETHNRYIESGAKSREYAATASRAFVAIGSL